MKENRILSFYIPCADETSAKGLVAQLLKMKLIACANIINAQSVYTWDGVVQQEMEKIAILKTLIEKEDACAEAIESLHSYDCPCIARYDMRVNEDYYNWVKSAVS